MERFDFKITKNARAQAVQNEEDNYMDHFPSFSKYQNSRNFFIEWKAIQIKDPKGPLHLYFSYYYRLYPNNYNLISIKKLFC